MRSILFSMIALGFVLSGAPTGLVVADAATAEDRLLPSMADPSRGDSYGQSCAGYNARDNSRSYSGVCVRPGICTGARWLVNNVSGSGSGVTFTDCAAAGLECCASQDVPLVDTTTGDGQSGVGQNSGGGANSSSGLGANQNSSSNSAVGWAAGKQRILDFNLPNETVGSIAEAFLFWLLTLLGFASMIAFLWAGAKYFLAAGDEKAAGEAKTAVKYSIYGIVVALAGVIIIRAITMLLDATVQF